MGAGDNLDQGDEFDTEVDEQDDADGQGGDNEDDGETVDTLRERLAKAEAALRRANRQAAKLRHDSKGKGGNADAEQAAERDAELDQWRTRSIRAEARAALSAAGAKPERVGRLVKLIDTADVEFDGDDIIGLDEQIAELKDDMPELFRSDDDSEQRVRAVRRNAPRIAGGARRSAAQSETDPALMQVRRLMGLTGRNR